MACAGTAPVKKNWQVARRMCAITDSKHDRQIRCLGVSHFENRGRCLGALSHRSEPLFESPAIDNNPGVSLVAVCDHLHGFPGFHGAKCSTRHKLPPDLGLSCRSRVAIAPRAHVNCGGDRWTLTGRGNGRGL